MEDIANDLAQKGYKLIRPVGSGGFSTCYLVNSEKYNKLFVCKAMKIRNDKIVGCNAEVHALCNVSHPNIILCFDYFTIPNYECLILEYCPGGSIADYIDKCIDRKPEELKSFVEQMILSVQYLHHLKIVHHDIKPSNFLIDKNERINLSDFGISKVYPDEKLSTQYKGTLSFMAPEILAKKPYDPFKADVYSLGLTIYNLITGKPLFQSPDPESLKKQIISGIWYFDDDFPRNLKPFIKRCISLDPDDRPDIDFVLGQWRMVTKKTASPMSTSRLPTLVSYRKQIKDANEQKMLTGSPINSLFKSRSRPLFTLKNV